MFKSLGHAAVSLSNFAAVLPIKHSILQKDAITLALVSLSVLSSLVFHTLFPDHSSARVRMPMLLLLDRLFAVLLTFRIFFSPSHKGSLSSRCSACVVNCCHGLCGRLLFGTCSRNAVILSAAFALACANLHSSWFIHVCQRRCSWQETHHDQDGLGSM